MPGLLALSIGHFAGRVTKEVDAERLARQSPGSLELAFRSDLWLHPSRKTDRAQAASLADRSCEFLPSQIPPLVPGSMGALSWKKVQSGADPATSRSRLTSGLRKQPPVDMQDFHL